MYYLYHYYVCCFLSVLSLLSLVSLLLSLLLLLSDGRRGVQGGLTITSTTYMSELALETKDATTCAAEQSILNVL